MQNMVCNVCGCNLDAILYESSSGRSLTSLSQTYPGVTRVRACSQCGHLQSDQIEDVEAYYDQDYTILVDSEEEDQIYEVQDGKPVYRTGHQVATFKAKVSLRAGARLLDYGCAKSSTFKALVHEGVDIIPHLFDVSERYIPFWEKFVTPENWATYKPPSEWHAYFDVVTSFFSLEHIVWPAETLQGIFELLKPGGVFYFIVPNVLTNTADFIVADHVNHFTRTSLTHLVQAAGLKLVEIDDFSHRGAFVVVAAKPVGKVVRMIKLADKDVAETLRMLETIAVFWNRSEAKVRSYETEIDKDETIAVYGAGFYSAFISACLQNPDRIRCFLDQNPFLHGRHMNGKPILSPTDLPEDVSTLMVGLNPTYAKNIIADVAALTQRDLRYFYL